MHGETMKLKNNNQCIKLVTNI